MTWNCCASCGIMLRKLQASPDPLPGLASYFDDMVPFGDKDSWASFWFRTVGVLILCAINYAIFYYAGWGGWGLGNPLGSLNSYMVNP
ncbi:MAG: hypothetical protein R2941_11605 [Desulfobacterales bacterium]